VVFQTQFGPIQRLTRRRITFSKAKQHGFGQEPPGFCSASATSVEGSTFAGAVRGATGQRPDDPNTPGLCKGGEAIELAGTGIRVNIVGPGAGETGMFNRSAQSKEEKANFIAANIPSKRISLLKESPHCSRVLARC
jgi:hypothetical protein